MKHKANSSAAAWALIMEGLTAARLEAHRLDKLVQTAGKLVDESDARDHLYQVAGDVIMATPQRLQRLIRHLDRTSYALAKIGEGHLKDRLSIEDRALVEDGTTNTAPFGGGGQPHTGAERVARKWEARRAGGR